MAKVGVDSRVTLGVDGVTAMRWFFLAGVREVGAASAVRLVGLEGVVETVGFLMGAFLGVGLRVGGAWAVGFLTVGFGGVGLFNVGFGGVGFLLEAAALVAAGLVGRGFLEGLGGVDLGAVGLAELGFTLVVGLGLAFFSVGLGVRSV